MQDVRYTLDGGRQFTFPLNGIYLGGSKPRPGAILIAGSEPMPWVSWAELRAASVLTPDGCYVLYGEATASPTHLFQTVRDARGDVAMVFPKSAGWTDQGLQSGTNQLAGGYTCLNPEGEAFHRGI